MKTQLADFLYLYQPLEWLYKNRETKIKLKIFYFSLELTKTTKMLAAISYKLHKDYNIIISPDRLQSKFKDYILDKKILDIIKSKEFTDWLSFVESHVEFIDDVRYGYSIFNIIKAYAEANGKYIYKTVISSKEDGTTEEIKVKDKYIPNDPDEFVEIIVDHVGLLSHSKAEGGLYSAIQNFSSIYMVEARNRWNYIPVIVAQQAALSEQQQFTYKGETVVEKLKPSADGIGDNKSISRDSDLMLGLFWPQRYNIQEYDGWNLTRMGKYHRELLILANRNGTSNASINLYFNGATNIFRELPKEPTEDIYRFLEKHEQNEIKAN